MLSKCKHDQQHIFCVDINTCVIRQDTHKTTTAKALDEPHPQTSQNPHGAFLNQGQLLIVQFSQNHIKI